MIHLTLTPSYQPGRWVKCKDQTRRTSERTSLKRRSIISKKGQGRGTMIGIASFWRLSCFLKNSEDFHCFGNLRSRIFIGLKQLQEWTKQSLKEKPFSTAKGKIWTETPSNIPLEKIFTKLRWVEIDRKTHKVTYVNLPDITKLLSNPKLEGKGPVRILVIGKLYYYYYLILSCNRNQ